MSINKKRWCDIKQIRQNYQKVYLNYFSFHCDRMKQWIREIQFVKQIATHLLLPRKTNYHDDYLFYKLSTNTHLKHINFKTPNQFNEMLNATLIKHKQYHNDTCIIFLHGYGSNKQEGLTLIDCLPKQIDLCCFDFTASGKSQGTITTYGLKEFRDLRAIIHKLKQQNFGYKRFILWGRSMGAVASFLMACSLQTCDIVLKKDIIFQVLDSPFSSFQSICVYQGRQSFNLPQTFISYGIEILKSHFKDHQTHLNPFNIDLIKASSQCETHTLFVYSQQDDMIPKENSLSIIQKLPLNISYEKLLINENHNTLRSQQTNQQVFKIIIKNYFKHLYNVQKSQSFKSKNNINSSIASERIINKIQSQINLTENNMVSKPYLETNPTLQTPSNLSRKQPQKKEKKYLELFSTHQKSKKKTTKFKNQIKQIKIDIGQIHSYRNNSTKNNKNTNNGSKFEKQLLIENETMQDYKKSMNSINSFKDIHKLRRSNTFDCPEGYQGGDKVYNVEYLEKAKNYQSLISTAMKTNDFEASLKQTNKTKRRALYCSLKKNYVVSKIGINSNKSNQNVFIEEPNNEEIN